MPDRSTVAYAALLATVAVLGFLHLRGRDGEAVEPAAAPIALSTEPPGGGEGGRVTVHVAGAVRRPGVLRLPAGSRVDDAVRRAGGATRRADLTAVNLAARVEDGRQVVVPEKPRRAPGGTAAGAVAPAGAGGAGGPLDLNTATLEQLDELDGLGPAMAQRILDYREEQGGFGSVEELSRVPGIGEKRMAALREAVTV